ncbi:MAG: repressor LexA [Chloroflexi bacterium]|nr:repressor LexA [Chloroflexota bacterium]
MKALSLKQRRILDYIREFLEDRGYPPTIRDIQRGCGLSSTSVVDYNLRALERSGTIRRDRELSRGIELLGESRGRARRVPLIGAIAAGQPIPVPTADTWHSTDGAEYIEVPRELGLRSQEVFALRVKGNSMVDALIGDGDIVLLEPAASVDNGDTAAVWLKLEKEVTLKRVYRERGFIRLQPANAAMKPLKIKADNLEIQGKVVGVIRKLS